MCNAAALEVGPQLGLFGAGHAAYLVHLSDSLRYCIRAVLWNNVRIMFVVCRLCRCLFTNMCLSWFRSSFLSQLCCYAGVMAALPVFMHNFSCCQHWPLHRLTAMQHQSDRTMWRSAQRDHPAGRMFKTRPGDRGSHGLAGPRPDADLQPHCVAPEQGPGPLPGPPPDGEPHHRATLPESAEMPGTPQMRWDRNLQALFRREHLKTLVDLHGTEDGLGGGQCPLASATTGRVSSVRSSRIWMATCSALVVSRLPDCRRDKGHPRRIGPTNQDGPPCADAPEQGLMLCSNA